MVAQVLATFAVPHEGKHQVLRAPRYVADFLLREMYRSSSVPMILTAPIGEASDEVVHRAASMWDPVSAALLSDPAVLMGVVTTAMRE